MLGVLSFYCFGGQKTNCINESFNKWTKVKVSQQGSHRHCWRLDKLVYPLMKEVMDHHTMTCTP